MQILNKTAVAFILRFIVIILVGIVLLTLLGSVSDGGVEEFQCVDSECVD